MRSVLSKNEKDIQKLAKKIRQLETALEEAKAKADIKAKEAGGEVQPETEAELKKIMVDFSELMELIEKKMSKIATR